MTTANSLDVGLTLEQRVVLACARSIAAGGAPPSAGVVAAADPERLEAAGWEHGMLPHLCHLLLRTGPMPGMERFRQTFIQNGARALYLAGELGALLRAFDEAGIRALAYKGPALAVLAYGNPALRDFSDLDLMLRSEDLDRAGAVLERLGFHDASTAGGQQRETLLRHGHHLKYVRDGLLVELHWRFSKALFGFGEAVSDIWERATPVAIGGTAVPTLSPGDHLLGVVIHSSKGMWQVLEWSVSIARLCDLIPADEWRTLIRRARAWRCEDALMVSLLLGEELFGRSYPAAAAGPLPPSRNGRRLARQIARDLFSGELAGRNYVRAQFALRKSYRDKVRLAVRSLLTTGREDWTDGDRPGRSPLAVRLMRPLRLIRKYWRAG